MAAARHSTNFSTALASAATASANAQMRGVQNIADCLAALMEEIHGGEWKTFIDHGDESSFVLIRPIREKKMRKPRHGEVA